VNEEYVVMYVYAEFHRVSDCDTYMFCKLFHEQEIANARWFITQMYDRDVLVKLVQQMGGDESMVRSHPDTADTFFYAVV
jgi:hypothetical protein